MEVENQEDGSGAQGGGGVAGEGGRRGGEDQEQKSGAEAGGHSESLAGKQVPSTLNLSETSHHADIPFSGQKSME